MAGGRPSGYKPEYCDQAYKLCLLGADDKRIADFFEISEATLNRWKSEHPEFWESLKGGKENADAAVAASLYNRAKGYVGKKTVTATNGGIITDVQVVDEYVAPDTTAAIFWLKNRQPKQWRDKQEIDHSGRIDSAQTVISGEISPEQAAEAYAKLMG